MKTGVQNKVFLLLFFYKKKVLKFFLENIQVHFNKQLLKSGLSIDACISASLSNIVMDHLERQVTQKMRNNSLLYTRFADGILIIVPKSDSNKLKTIENRFTEFTGTIKLIVE